MRDIFAKSILSVALMAFVQSPAQAGSNDRHNLSNNAVGSVLGMGNLEYSYKLTDKLTVGIEGSTGKIDLGDIKIKGSSYGFISRYYFDSAFKNSSWYLLGSVVQNNYDASVRAEDVNYEDKIDGTVIGCGGGYHFFWNSFNLNLGLFAKNGEVIELKDSAGNPYEHNVDNRVGAEFNIGWKF